MKIINIITLTYTDLNGNGREMTQWVTRNRRLTYRGALSAINHDRQAKGDNALTGCTVSRIETATRS